MNTVCIKREMVEGKKVVTLDSDCPLNIDAIKESIQIVNNLKADYGLLTLWGVELSISKDAVAEDVLSQFKQKVKRKTTILP